MQGRILWGVATALGAVVCNCQIRAQDGVTPIPVKAPKVNQQTISVFMQAKLTNTQRAFSGLVDQDFGRIRKAARMLKLTSFEGPNLQSDDLIEDKAFEHFEIEFIRLSEKLEQMADQKNLEGATFVYQNLTSTCIACHQHIRDTATTAKGDRRAETERDSPRR